MQNNFGTFITEWQVCIHAYLQKEKNAYNTQNGVWAAREQIQW